MNTHEVDTRWTGEAYRLEATVQGHTIVMDTPERVGGTNLGPVPKPLLLTALSGCTAMDVLSLMRQEPVKPTALTVHVTGDLTDRHPITYTRLHVVYTMEGPEEGRNAAIAAVTKSLTQLCGVGYLLKQVVPIHYTLGYNYELALEGQLEPTLQPATV